MMTTRERPRKPQTVQKSADQFVLEWDAQVWKLTKEAYEEYFDFEQAKKKGGPIMEPLNFDGKREMGIVLAACIFNYKVYRHSKDYHKLGYITGWMMALVEQMKARGQLIPNDNELIKKLAEYLREIGDLTSRLEKSEKNLAACKEALNQQPSGQSGLSGDDQRRFQ